MLTDKLKREWVETYNGFKTKPWWKRIFCLFTGHNKVDFWIPHTYRSGWILELCYRCSWENSYGPVRGMNACL